MPAGLFTPTQILTDWQCAGGLPVATLPLVLDWTLEETIEEHLVMKRLTLRLPLNHPDWDQYDQLIVGRVIRGDYRDASTTPPTDDLEEFRITDLVEDVRAGVATVSATWWLQDLLERNKLVQRSGLTEVLFTTWAATPTNALSLIDAALPSYWDIGTVTPTDTVDVAHDHDTPMAGGVRVAAASKMRSGVTYELSPRRNGTSGLYLDLTVFGGGAVDVRPAKNLNGVQRTRRRADQTTRAYFSRDGAMKRPTYVVTAVNAGVSFDVQEVNGLGPGPAREDDQWNGASWREEKNNTSHPIADVVRVDYNTTRFLVASTTTIVAGDRGFLTDGSGNDLLYVDSPAYQAIYGVRLGVLEGGDEYTNYVRNPDLRLGSTTTPTGWTISGTPDRRDATTGLVRQGGYSYFVPSSAALTWSQVIRAEVDELWTYVAYLFMVTAGTGVVRFTNPQTGGTDDVAFTTLKANTYAAVPMTYQVTSGGNKTFQFSFATGSGSCYADAGQLTRSSGEVAFRTGSGPANNIALANAHFDSNGAPLSTYDLDLDDLAIVDPVTYGDDRPGLGAICYLTEPTLDETRNGLRIVKRTLTARNQANPRIQLSTRPKRFTALVAA